MTTILIVEDDPKIRANLQFQLRDEGFAVRTSESAEAARAELDSGSYDLLLLDVRLPGASGLDLVRALAETDRLPPTVIVSGEASITETVDALHLGVHDFIEKPFSRERLLQSLRNALEHSALKREVAELRSRSEDSETILGGSEEIEKVRELIGRAGPLDARVLVRGESGTGKELVATALQRSSSRHERALIKINCAAIPSHLIEDELFGHAKGAFTDAKQAKPGLFEEADGGTLFLDEIGDMEYGLQSRLLRVLEDGVVRRIGETKDRAVDVRVIAATHCDLEASVKEGDFREDLYFRLAHLPIEIPPLRHRSVDVKLLFEHFLDVYCARHRSRSRRVDETVWPVLETYRWPGNVRELRNLCERLVVFGTDPITLDQLPSVFFEGVDEAGETGLVRLEGGPSLPLREFRERCEREYVESVLRRTNWNVAAAARVLEIQRTYLHQKMASLGLQRPRFEVA